MNRVAPALFLLTGAGGLAYQTVWMRMLVRVFGVTVYATTTVVAIFMAGAYAASASPRSFLNHPQAGEVLVDTPQNGSS